MYKQKLSRGVNLLVVIALAWLPFAPATAALGCGVGEVSGIITAADTGLPISNISVVAAGYSYRTTNTDPNGHYAFQYQTANGPTPISLAVAQTGHYVGVQTNLLSVVSGTVNTQSFALAVGASITGVVRGSDVITPLENVSVVLSSTTVLTGTPPVAQFTKTNANGYYQIQGIAPGSYKLRFDPTFGETFVITLNKYMPAYYGGAGEAVSAPSINVTTPTTITANAVLTPGATITGVVSAADTAAGLVDFRAYVVSPGHPDLSAYALQSFGVSNFLVQGLRPGSYALVVYPYGILGSADTREYVGQYYNNQSALGTANLITINQITQTVGVSVALQRGGVITGEVKDAGTGLPVAGAGIDLTSDAPDLSGTGTFHTSVTANASGVYSATGLPTGHYTATFDYQPGYTAPYHSQVYNGHDMITNTVAGNLVAVTPLLTMTNINFSLHPILTGTITGRALDNHGQGVPFVAVTLHRTDSVPPLGRVYDYADAHGYYTATVEAASYLVEFSRDTTAQCGGCYNDQFYTGTGQSPKAVQLNSSAVVSNINAILPCGQAAPPPSLYLPLIQR